LLSSFFYRGALFALSSLICIQPVCAEVLSLESVLSCALENSYDAKIFQEDALAGQAYVREAQSGYYPQISVRFSNDYIHSFTEGDDVVAGGDVVIADESSYRHSFISSLSYTLYDFGVRARTVENAHHQVQVAKLQEQQAYWETRKQVLQYFADGLKLQRRIEAETEILERQNTIFRLAKQLRHAGSLGREQVGVAALLLAETLNQLEDLRLSFQETLSGLTFYTQREYHTAQVRFVDFSLPQIAASEIELEAVPEVKIYQEQIDIKKAELSMVKASMLPKLMLYGSHRVFGSDYDQFNQSLSDMRARDATVSVVLEWPIFSGFADTAKKTRLNHEINSLRYQKEKKKAELKQELASLTGRYQTYHSVETNRTTQVDQIVAEQDDALRLAEQQISDQISFHRKMIELERQRLEHDLWRVDYAASALALSFINEVVQ